jgi:RNA polymerase sigma factor (sigma-70 family)
MSEPLLTVFVVDDDPSVRKSLARLLRSAGYEAETFATTAEFLDRRRARSDWGCLVLDVQMPGQSGLELQRELSQTPEPIPIVFITGHGDIRTSVTAMKAGAVNFLSKPLEEADLLEAVREAGARGRQQQADFARRHAIEERYESLTARERQVLALVARGLPNKQIAAQLGIGEKTVKVHRARVMSKMDVRSLADLVRTALAIGISAPPKSLLSEASS